MSDPIIEYYKQFVDRERLRANLRLTVDERLLQLQQMAAEQPPRKQPPSPDRPWEPVSDCSPNRTTDPIIELYKRDVDRTLLRENLKLTPEQRLLKLEDFVNFVSELRQAARRRTLTT
jgi:hypothetical protein